MKPIKLYINDEYNLMLFHYGDTFVASYYPSDTTLRTIVAWEYNHVSGGIHTVTRGEAYNPQLHSAFK